MYEADAGNVWCPSCLAAVGDPCQTFTGRVRDDFHAMRTERAARIISGGFGGELRPGEKKAVPPAHRDTQEDLFHG